MVLDIPQTSIFRYTTVDPAEELKNFMLEGNTTKSASSQPHIRRGGHELYR